MEEKMRAPRKFWFRIGIPAALLLLAVILYLFLLSSIAMDWIWLPMAKKHTGIEIRAEKCSVSLFSPQTLVAENVTVKLPGWKAVVPQLFLSANPLGFFFSGELVVSELRISGIKLEEIRRKAVRPSDSSRGTVPRRSVPKKTKKIRNIILRKAVLTDASVCF